MQKHVIILQKDNETRVFSTLKGLCKAKIGFSYYHLRNIDLTERVYKGYLIMKRPIERY
jgi:hypothetical protein